MLVIDNTQHLMKVLHFAMNRGKTQALLDQLFFLHTYSCRDRDTPLEAPSNFHPLEVAWPPPEWAAYGGNDPTRKVETYLYSDFAPASFGFTINVNGQRWFNGGLIYHGPQAGWELPNGTFIPEGHGVETFSVTFGVEAERPWQVHT
jgi:hypothetical protein